MDSDSWDLEAVVRGACRSTAAASVDPFSSFRLQEREALFPDHSTVATSYDHYELEELCRPFILSSPAPPASYQRQNPHRPPSQIPPRSKRRKNQVKKVVREVSVDGAPHDPWAWRKYGQKPIKGSPHPRGYYRCSSSKGCPARKQVERSRTDPSVLVVTYTADHNHPVPTHRSALAGITRHKPTPQPPPSAESPGRRLSPTTPLNAFSVDDDEFMGWGEESDVLLAELEGATWSWGELVAAEPARVSIRVVSFRDEDSR